MNFRFLEVHKLTALQFNQFWELLVEEKKQDLIPETVAFFPTFPFVWAGTWVPAGEIAEHVNTIFCKANNIPILWEPAMGGAYFFPDKNWNCYFIADMKKNFVERVERWLEFLNALKVGLVQLGVNATVDKNNIMVGTRKISGVSVTHYGNKVTGITPSINVDFDYDLANEVLMPLGRRNKDLSKAIISLNELGVNLEPMELNPYFKDAIEQEFGIKLITGTLTDAEKAVTGLA